MPYSSIPALRTLGGISSAYKRAIRGPSPVLRERLPDGFETFEEYDTYLRGLKDYEEEKSERRNRVINDPEYRKLLSEQYGAITEMTEDSAATVALNLKEGVLGAPGALKKTGQELVELGAEIFGASDEFKEGARQAREEVSREIEENKAEALRGTGGGGGSEFAYEFGQAAATEVPFMVASGGSASAMKAAAKRGLKKKITERVGEEAAEGVLKHSLGKKLLNDKLDEVSTRTAMGVMTGVHAPRSAGGGWSEAVESLHPQYVSALQAQNRDNQFTPEQIDKMAYEQARETAVAPAIASGVITGALITAFGATGVERMFANPKAFKPALRDLSEQFGFEATEEGLDQYIQGVMAKHSYNPDKPMEEIMSETWHAAILGGLIGAKMSAPAIAVGKLREARGEYDSIDQRFAAWRNPALSKEAARKWVEDHTEATGEQAEEIIEILSTVEQMKRILELQAEGATKDEAESEAINEQKVTEEELNDLEDQGHDTTGQRKKNEELASFRSRGVAAGEIENENALDEAEQIEAEEGIEAAEEYIEGFNSVAEQNEMNQSVSLSAVEQKVSKGEELNEGDLEMITFAAELIKTAPQTDLGRKLYKTLDSIGRKIGGGQYDEASEQQVRSELSDLPQDFYDTFPEAPADASASDYDEFGTFQGTQVEQPVEGGEAFDELGVFQGAEVVAAPTEEPVITPLGDTTLEEDIDSVWDDVFPALIEKFGKGNLGIFNKERIAGVVGRLRAAEAVGDVAGMNKELSKLIGVIPRDTTDPAQMTRVEDVIQKEADRLLGGLEDSVLLDFIRKRKKYINDAGRDWRDSLAKSSDGSMMEEGEPAPVFSEALERGLIDERGNETEQAEGELETDTLPEEDPNQGDFMGLMATKLDEVTDADELTDTALDLFDPSRPPGVEPEPEAAPEQTPIPWEGAEYDAEEGGFVPTSGTSPMVSLDGRMITIADVNGVKVPFYLSTGRAGKRDVIAGKWYPFFGIGNDGWLNKGSQSDINSYYNSPALREAALRLDDSLGDTRQDPNVPVATKKRKRGQLVSPSIVFINETVGLPGLTHEEVVSNRAGLDSNIAEVIAQFEGRREVTVPGELSMPELAPGEERGSVAFPETIPDTSIDRGERAPVGSKFVETDPQVELESGEETEVDLSVPRVEYENPDGNTFVISIDRGSRADKRHYDSVEQFRAEPESHIGMVYHSAGRADVLVKHNRKEGVINLGYIDELGRFRPTHILKNYTKVKKGFGRNPGATKSGATHHGWIIPKSVVSGKSLTDENIWEPIPGTSTYNRFLKAKQAGMSETRLINLVISEMKNVAKPALSQMMRQLQDNGALGMESVAATILAANRYRKTGKVYPRTLIEKGNYKRLAKEFEKSLTILSEADRFFALMRDESVELTEQGTSEEAELERQQALSRHASLLNLLHANLTPPTKLTFKDFKVWDVGQQPGTRTVAEFPNTNRGAVAGYRAASKQANKRKKLPRELALAQIITEVNSETKGQLHEMRVKRGFKRYEFEIRDADRIPLDKLISALKEVYPGKQFELGIGALKPDTDMSVHEAKAGLQGTRKKVDGRSVHVTAGGTMPMRDPVTGKTVMGNPDVIAKAPRRKVNRATLDLSGPETALDPEFVDMVRAIVKSLSDTAKKAPIDEKYNKVHNKELKLEAAKAKRAYIKKAKEEISKKLLHPDTGKRLREDGDMPPPLTEAESKTLKSGLTKNDKAILAKGSVVSEWWAKTMKPKSLITKGSNVIKRLYEEGQTRDFQPELIPFRSVTKEGPKPKFRTEEYKRGELPSDVIEYRAGGKKVFIAQAIDPVTGEKLKKFEYTLDRVDNTPVALPAAKNMRQAKSAVADLINIENSSLNLAAVGKLMSRLRDLKGQETQQAVGLEALDTARKTARLRTSPQSVEEGTAEDSKESEAFVEDAPLTEAELEERAVVRFRDKKQPSDPMPPKNPILRKQGPATPKKKIKNRNYEQTPTGKWVYVPVRFANNNDWRTSHDLYPVEKIKGKWHEMRPSQPIELSRAQQDPNLLNVESEETGRQIEGLEKWLGKTPTETTQGERIADARYSDIPVTDGTTEFNIELTEGQFNRVKGIIESHGGLKGFLNHVEKAFEGNEEHGAMMFTILSKFVEDSRTHKQEIINSLREKAQKISETTGPLTEGQNKAANEERIRLLREADFIERQGPTRFKRSLNKHGKNTLRRWAKWVSPNEWMAVMEYAEEIYRHVTPNKKLKAKAKKAEENALQVPSDIPVAKGAVALKELVSRSDNGLSTEERITTMRLLDSIAPELLEKLSLKVGAELNSNGDTEVEYLGEFNSLQNLITLAGDSSTDPDALLEEIAHFTAKLLPDDLRQQAVKLHTRAVGDAITKAESEIKTATGDDRLALSSKLGVLRTIKERGQLTSDEFRGILPKSAEVGADVFDSIIEDTYHLSNADEFYANAMVTRVGDSEFGRARQFLNNILDAIKAVFGNANAQVNQFIGKAKKSLADPNKANKNMRGMLMRENVIAKSLKTLVTPGKLAGSVATSMLQAEGAAELGQHEEATKMRQTADDRVSQAGAVVSVYESVLRRVLPGLHPHSDVAKYLKANDMDYILSLVDGLPSSSDYKQTYNRFIEEGRPELARTTALYAFQYIRQMEVQTEELRARADQAKAEVSSDVFINRVKRVAKKEKSVEADLENGVRASLEMARTLLKKSTDPGSRANALTKTVGLEEINTALAEVTALAEATKKLANILSATPEGLELFNRPDIREAAEAAEGDGKDYMTGDEIAKLAGEVYNYVTRLGVNKKDENMWRVASTLFVANSGLRKNAVILSMPFFEAKAAGERRVAELFKILSSPDKDVRMKKLDELFTEVVDLSSKQGRERYVAKQMMASVNNDLQRAADLDRAATAAEKVMADPEFLEYRQMVGEQAKVDDVPSATRRLKKGEKGEVVVTGQPTFYEDLINNTLYIPKPPDKHGPDKKDNVVKIQFFSGQEGIENLKLAHEAAVDIHSWLMDNMDEHGKPTSPHWNYYWNTLQQLQATYTHELVWNLPTNQRTIMRDTFFGIMNHMIDNTPTRAAQLTKRYIDKHEMYYTFFDQWKAKRKAKWTNLLIRAAKSRPGEFANDTVFKIKQSKEYQKTVGIANWEKRVGRYLRDSWQESGMRYDVGDFLPNGEQITKEDMELIRYEDEITNQVYEFNENIASLDESAQPLRVTDFLNIKRLPMKRGPRMTPRRFSQDGRELVKHYEQAKENRKVGAALYDEIFTGADGKQAIISFLSDRDPEWVTSTGVHGSGWDDVYGIITGEIRDGSMKELGLETNPEGVAERLSQLTGVPVVEVKEQIIKEIDPVMNELFSMQNPAGTMDSPTLEIQSLDAPTSLTAARLDKVAPGFFYTLGFNNDPDFQAFVAQGQMPAAENVIKALKSTSDEMEQTLSKLGQMFEKKQKELGKDRLSKEVQNAVAKELGIELRGPASLESLLGDRIQRIKKYTTEFEGLYGTTGEKSAYYIEDVPSTAQRAYGTIIGALLVNPIVAMRNNSESVLHGAVTVLQLTGQTGPVAFTYALLRSLMTNVLNMGASFVVSTAKVAVYKLPVVGVWRMSRRLTGLDGHPPRIAGAVAALLTPAVQEYAEVMPRRLREHKLLDEQNLGMAETPEETALNFAEFLETGGRVMRESDVQKTSESTSGITAIFKRLFYNGLGNAEQGLAVLGRPLLQRLGDVNANNLLANLAQSVGHTWQRKAKVAYANRIKTGSDLGAPASIEEVAGSYLAVFKANKLSIGEAREFFAASGVPNFEAAIEDYWRRLAAAPNKKAQKQEKLFTQKQLDRMAAVMVMQNNTATPHNRPMWMKKSRPMNMGFAMQGWSFNQSQNWVKMTHKTSSMSRNDKNLLRLQKAIMIAGAIGFQIPMNALLEMLSRHTVDALYGQKRITRLPWETQGGRDEAYAWMSLGTQSIPLIGSSLNALWLDAPGRPQHMPGNLILKQTMAAVNIGIGWYDTKSAEHTFITGINQLLPISRAVTYRVSEWQRDKTINDNAFRRLRAVYGDPKMRKGIFAGTMLGGKKLDEFTPYREYFGAAVAGENWEEAGKIFDEAIKVYQYTRKIETGKKVGYSDAVQAVKSSFGSMNPVSRALRIKPTFEEFYKNISHATESDQEAINTSVNAWRKAFTKFQLGSSFFKKSTGGRGRPGRRWKQSSSGPRAVVK
jgi:hypothetical protein